MSEIPVMIDKIEKLKNVNEEYKSIEPIINKKASVVIPLIACKDGIEILFEKRNSKIPQGGEICFPGGVIEDGETPDKTAVRELKEELLINDEQVDFITKLHLMSTEYGTQIFSNLVIIKDYNWTFSKSEVESVFSIPISWFIENEPEVYDAHLIRDESDDLPYELIPNGKGYDWKSLNSKLYFYRSEPEIIWGLTAKLLYYFIKSI